MNSNERIALIKHYADKISASTVHSSDNRWRLDWAERIIELIKEDEDQSPKAVA
jgi:hypothetical protein